VRRQTEKNMKSRLMVHIKKAALLVAITGFLLNGCTIDPRKILCQIHQWERVVAAILTMGISEINRAIEGCGEYEMRHLPWQSEKTTSELEDLAERGDAKAAFSLYLRSDDPRRKWRWLCRAGDDGSREARIMLGHNYRFGWHPAALNVERAYMWYSLALQVSTDEDLNHSKSIIEEMNAETTASQISNAQLLVKAWKPGECEREGISVFEKSDVQ
jgi:hypothetical protein